MKTSVIHIKGLGLEITTSLLINITSKKKL